MKRTLSLLSATVVLATPAAAPAQVPLPTQQAPAPAEVFRHVGTYRVRSRLKVTDDRVTRVEIKPLVFKVTTNGLTIRLTTEEADDAASTFEIYRSDGIGRQNRRSGVLEVIPGVQASSMRDGVMRHIRVSRESLTITEFGGVSNQTVITHAAAITADPPTRAAAAGR